MSEKQHITRDQLTHLVKKTVLANSIPGNTDEEKKQWCVAELQDILESFDGYIPIVGAWLDNVVADEIERQAIVYLVDWAWKTYVGTHEEHSEKSCYMCNQ